jgi:DME family drug/metabolite transporter
VVTLLLGGAVLAPWTLPELSELAAPRSLDLITWLGPATVALAYWLYVAGLRGLTAATAGTLSLAEPQGATALGVGMLHEHLSLPIAAGTLLLLGGLTIVSISWPRIAAMPETRVGSARNQATPRVLEDGGSLGVALPTIHHHVLAETGSYR